MFVDMTSLIKKKNTDVKPKHEFVSGRTRSSGREKPIDSQSLPGEIKLSLVATRNQVCIAWTRVNKVLIILIKQNWREQTQHHCTIGQGPSQRATSALPPFCMKMLLSLSCSMSFSRVPLLKTKTLLKFGYFRLQHLFST